MSEQQVPEAFWDRVDEIIKTANQQVEEAKVGEVSSSTLYAAARFNAYNIANSAGSLEQLEEEKQKAINYFIDQYRKMLEASLDDYINNFDHYSSQ